MTRPAAPTTPRLDRCTEPVPEKLRTHVLRELGKLHARINELTTLVGASSSSGASPDAPYVTYSATAALSAERRLVDGTNTTVNVSNPGEIAIDAPAAGAPTGAQYVTLATHASLSAERVLTQGTGITVTDGGANGAVTIATTITQYTDEMARDALGSAIVGGTGITVTPNDGADTITIATTITQYTDEMARDALGTALVAGNGIDITVNDGADTILIDVDESELALQAAQYVVMSTTTALPNERRLREGHGIDLTDGGPGGDATIAVDESEFSLGNGLLWNGSALEVDYAAVANRVIYEVDFTALANNTFANGTETIDGLNWTCASTSNTSRTIFDIQNGTGLRWTAPTSSATAFDTASQTAAHIYIDLSAFTLWRPEEDLIVEVQYTGTFENGNDGFYFGLWGQANSPVSIGTASAIRMECANRANSGGNQTIRTLHNATLNSTNVIDVSAHDCAMARFTNDGPFSTFYGTYSGGFPTAAYNVGIAQLTQQSVVNSMMCRNTRLVLAFRSVSDASPTSAVTITRMRLRRGI